MSYPRQPWWTTTKIREVRYYAEEEGLSAARIAAHVSGEWRRPVSRKAIYSVCQRHGIRLQGESGRPRIVEEPLTQTERNKRWRQRLRANGVREKRRRKPSNSVFVNGVGWRNRLPDAAD